VLSTAATRAATAAGLLQSKYTAPLLVSWLPVRGARAREGPVADNNSRPADWQRRITLSRQVSGLSVDRKETGRVSGPADLNAPRYVPDVNCRVLGPFPGTLAGHPDGVNGQPHARTAAMAGSRASMIDHVRHAQRRPPLSCLVDHEARRAPLPAVPQVSEIVGTVGRLAYHDGGPCGVLATWRKMLMAKACDGAVRYALFRWRDLLFWECWPGQCAARALCAARAA
jgi:hypothetical protein